MTVSTFSQMKVFTKLVAGFFAVVALLIALGGFRLYEISGENDHVALLSENSLPAVLNSLEMKSSLRAIRLGDYRAATASSSNDIKTASRQVDQAIAEYLHAADQYEPLINSPEEKRHYVEVRATISRYLDADRSIRTLAKDGKHEDELEALQDSVSASTDAIGAAQ